MRISVVNLNSDSSDAEYEDKSVANYTTTKLYTCEKSSQTFFCESEKSVAEQRVPLFKIIFKDESTSRIYRKKLEDIAKNLVAAKPHEDSDSTSSDLVLEIYESTESPNTSITSDSMGMQTPVIEYCNPNSSFTFSYNQEINAQQISIDEANSQNNNVLPTNSFDHANQPANISGTLIWSAQPQELQHSFVQPDFSTSINLNKKKRKRKDDSDLSSLRKKLKVDCESECSTSQFQSESDTLANINNNNISGTSYYDPVWYNSSNPQSTVAESLEIQYYDPVWYNSSHDQSTVTESINEKKLRVSSSPAKDMSSFLKNKKISTTFTYRVLKIGSCDYVKKSTFTISKDGIQLCASHLNETSTVVKLNIAIDDVVKIEACFSKILPALFLYVNKNAASVIRETLGINKDYIEFFDPESTDDSCNKIIILPDNMPESCGVLKNMVKIGLITKLDKESANIILFNSFSKILERPNPDMKQFANNLFLKIISNSIRIGTYKCSKMNSNVKIYINGLQFHMPKVGDAEVYKKITVSFAEIDKIYFSLKMSVLFLHVNSLCAQRIRSLIEMSETDKSEMYFDPDSETIAEQRLVIVFNKIKPFQQEILITLLSNTRSVEITLPKIIHQMLYNHM